MCASEQNKQAWENFCIFIKKKNAIFSIFVCVIIIIMFPCYIAHITSKWRFYAREALFKICLTLDSKVIAALHIMYYDFFYLTVKNWGGG